MNKIILLLSLFTLPLRANEEWTEHWKEHLTDIKNSIEETEKWIDTAPDKTIPVKQIEIRKKQAELIRQLLETKEGDKKTREELEGRIHLLYEELEIYELLSSQGESVRELKEQGINEEELSALYDKAVSLKKQLTELKKKEHELRKLYDEQHKRIRLYLLKLEKERLEKELGE